MNSAEIKKIKLPDTPGVYMFKDIEKDILYIGKATSLQSRVRSYFTGDIVISRSAWIKKMTEQAITVEYEETDSVLEAFILEARLIKEHKPIYNTREKDDKSFNYITITNAEFPQVTIVRERDIYQQKYNKNVKYVFGPFPQGSSLRDALKIIRKIIPYSDTCKPSDKKPCFNYQIGLCPGVCIGEISKKEYGKHIQYIKLFFEGKKKQIMKKVEKEMMSASKKLEFEKATSFKKMLFSLEHIQDVSLISDDRMKAPGGFRVEGYDVAHISGKYVVGVMTVLKGGDTDKASYRKFKIKSFDGANDTRALEEILIRRFGHLEWQLPNLIVVDGGVAQKRRAEKVLRNLNFNIPVVAVVKDNRHKPKAVLGRQNEIESHKKDILLVNSEAHRFSVAYHRSKRDKIK